MTWCKIDRMTCLQTNQDEKGKKKQKKSQTRKNYGTYHKILFFSTNLFGSSLRRSFNHLKKFLWKMVNCFSSVSGKQFTFEWIYFDFNGPSLQCTKKWCVHSQNVCIRYTETSLLNPGKSKLMVSLPLVDLSLNMMACWLKFCKMHISWIFYMLIMNDSTLYSADGWNHSCQKPFTRTYVFFVCIQAIKLQTTITL